MKTSNNKDKLIDLLSPIQKKLTIKRLLYSIGRFSFLTIVSGVILLLIARFLPFPYVKLTTGILLGLCVIASFVYSFITKPTILATARIADSFNLEERVTTAIDSENNSSRLAKLQRNDTVNLLEKRLPIILEGLKVFPFKRKQVFGYLAILLLWLSLLILPNPMDTILAEQKSAKESLKAVEEKINSEQEDINKNNELTEDNKEKLFTELENLKEQLKVDSTIEEQLKELEKYKKELVKLQADQENKKSALEQVNEIVAKNEMLKDLMNGIIKNDEESLAKQLAEMKEQLKTLSESEQEALATILENAKDIAAKLTKELDDQDLKEITNNLQKAISGLQNGNTDQALNDLMSALAQSNMASAQSLAMANQLTNTVSALQQSQITAANGDPSLIESALANNTNGNSPTANNTGTSSDGQNQGSASGNGNAASGSPTDSTGNSGTGASSNSGSGNSNGGSGANGSGGNGQSGQGGGAGLGSGSHVISIPAERINSDGIIDTVSGPIGEGNGDTQISDNSNISTGISLPYEEVYKEYYQYVSESIDRKEIPAGYENIVRDYFSSIEP